MKVTADQIGSTTVLVELVDVEDVTKASGRGEAGGRSTDPAGLKEDMQEAYTSLKDVVREMAGEIGKTVNAVAEQIRPKQVKMEFNLALSAGSRLWVVTGKADVGVKVSLTWDMK